MASVLADRSAAARCSVAIAISAAAVALLGPDRTFLAERAVVAEAATTTTTAFLFPPRPRPSSLGVADRRRLLARESPRPTTTAGFPLYLSRRPAVSSDGDEGESDLEDGGRDVSASADRTGGRRRPRRSGIGDEGPERRERSDLERKIGDLFSVSRGSSSASVADPDVAYSVPSLETPRGTAPTERTIGGAARLPKFPSRLPEGTFSDVDPLGLFDGTTTTEEEVAIVSAYDGVGTAGLLAGGEGEPIATDAPAVDLVPSPSPFAKDSLAGGVDAEEDETTDDDAAGYYLDPDLYAASSEHLRPDGSLDLPPPPNPSRGSSRSEEEDAFRALTESILASSGPILPDDDGTGGEEEGNDGYEDERLLLAAAAASDRRERKSSPPKVDPEELHRRVFEQERGFQNQSDAFKRSLSGDAEDVDKATRRRRGADYRRRQNEAMEALEREMKDLEDRLLSTDEEGEDVNNSEKGNRAGASTKATCRQCGCRLSPEEIEHDAIDPSSDGPVCRVCHALEMASRSRNPNAAPPTSGGGWDERTNAPRPRRREGGKPRRYGIEGRRGARPDRGGRRGGPPTRSEAEADPPVRAPPTVDSRTQSLLQRMSQLEREVRAYKSRAERHEREVRSLRAVVASLEDALDAALSDDDDAGGEGWKDDAAAIPTEGTSVGADDSDSLKGGEAELPVTEERNPWTETVDPDTGDAFYWNEDTGEMRWK